MEAFDLAAAAAGRGEWDRVPNLVSEYNRVAGDKGDRYGYPKKLKYGVRTGIVGTIRDLLKI